MEKQYKLTDRVSKDSLKSPTFKKWLKRVLCLVCLLSLALQLTLCCLPTNVSAAESDSIVGTWVFNDVIDNSLPLDVKYSINFTYDSQLVYSGTSIFRTSVNGYQQLRYDYIFSDSSSTAVAYYYATNKWNQSYFKTINIIGGSDITNDTFVTWLKANATKVVDEVYDFTGEYRIFKPTLDILFVSSETVQSYQFDFNIYGGYNADHMNFVSDADEVQMWYLFTDEGSGGLRMMYRQNFGDESGTWLVPRARIIHFQSNPDDPTFQQWLLDNTILVSPDSIDVIYDAGYSHGFNDGWTDNVIGDTFNAPIQALNNMVLLKTADVTITLGGVIVTMIALSILTIYLKKYAGG